MPDEEDTRITMSARIAPLTHAQRDLLPAQLKELDETLLILRRTPLPDGGGEPCFRLVVGEPT